MKTSHLIFASVIGALIALFMQDIYAKMKADLKARSAAQ